MRHLIGGAVVGISLLLAGCAQDTQATGTTGVVAPGQTAAPAAGTATDASAAAVLPQVEKKSCEELKVEMTSFTEAKIPQKLEQFGQSKYTPTPDELPRFQRYVEVNQSMKTRCATMMQAEKPADAPKKKKKKVTKVEGAAAVAPAPAATPEASATDSSG
ncbi:MAG: hypothetical protein U1E49_06395 [Hyphomicrobiaceae bacterium]